MDSPENADNIFNNVFSQRKDCIDRVVYLVKLALFIAVAKPFFLDGNLMAIVKFSIGFNPPVPSSPLLLLGIFLALSHIPVLRNAQTTAYRGFQMLLDNSLHKSEIGSNSLALAFV